MSVFDRVDLEEEEKNEGQAGFGRSHYFTTKNKRVINDNKIEGVRVYLGKSLSEALNSGLQPSFSPIVGKKTIDGDQYYTGQRVMVLDFIADHRSNKVYAKFVATSTFSLGMSQDTIKVYQHTSG